MTGREILLKNECIYNFFMFFFCLSEKRAKVKHFSNAISYELLDFKCWTLSIARQKIMQNDGHGYS